MATIRSKVFVGMSGGVDSSVSAALLKRAGFDVTGVFIKVWQPDFIPCTWKEDRQDAMRVAAHLDIPFITLDLEKEYKRDVVDYMIKGYRSGITPNPDVMCNKSIKFGAFFRFAREKGADFVATGHYAQINQRSKVKGQRSERKLYQLLEGKDKNKDQSYFLYNLTQKELAHTIFPIGGLEKTKVRRLARRFRLPNAEKKDSQGLCFLGKIEMREFLKNFIKEKPGRVLNEKKEVIGRHDGAFFFTIGQRHGFIVTKKGSDDRPYYVINKDIKKNILTVSNRKEIQEQGLSYTECLLEDVNWVRGRKAEDARALFGRIRYRQEKQKITLSEIKKDRSRIRFEKSQEGLSAGQSLVVYDADVCLGGGVIV